MRRNIVIQSAVLAGLCALVPVSAAQAQQTEREVVRVMTRTSSGWLGFGYSGGQGSEPVVIDTVFPESPAGRAGMQKADTLTAVNGLRATDQLLRSLGLRPGDEVQLTVRRAGSERSLRIVAGERPRDMADSGGWSVHVDPDRIIEAIRIQLDSIDLPRINVQTLPDSSGRMMMIRRQGEQVDTVRLDFNTDSIGRNVFIFGDSMRIFRDSAMSNVFQFFDGDLRTSMDSVFGRLGRPGMHFRFSGDSVFVLGGDTIQLPQWSNQRFSFNVPRIARVGFSSVAGMELEELSERLGEYFGAEYGLLVLQVADETPAARAGLQDGDVILQADGEEVRTIAELRRILARSRGEHVRLQILRERRELTRTLQMDAERSRQ